MRGKVHERHARAVRQGHRLGDKTRIILVGWHRHADTQGLQRTDVQRSQPRLPGRQRMAVGAQVDRRLRTKWLYFISKSL